MSAINSAYNYGGYGNYGNGYGYNAPPNVIPSERQTKNTAAKLVQSFLDVTATEGIDDGILTKGDLIDYKHRAGDSLDADQAKFLKSLLKNFDKIAKKDGDARGISLDDLLKPQAGIPSLPGKSCSVPYQNDPYGDGSRCGNGNGNGSNPMFSALSFIMDALQNIMGMVGDANRANQLPGGSSWASQWQNGGN